MWAIGRQLDQVDAAVRPSEEFTDVWALVVSSVVPDHMDEAFLGIARLNLGKKLRRADPVYGVGLDKGRVESFKVERTAYIHAPAPCGSCHGGF